MTAGLANPFFLLFFGRAKKLETFGRLSNGDFSGGRVGSLQFWSIFRATRVSRLSASLSVFRNFFHFWGFFEADFAFFEVSVAKKVGLIIVNFF